MKLFLVGGAVRDHLLGLPCDDMDYSMVMDQEYELEYTPEQAFEHAQHLLTAEGYEIFQTTPEFYTIRAKFPKNHRHSGVADFVLARKEIRYIPGTRTPIVKIGTIEDDLERRDFTVNAIAKDLETGKLIDPYGGIRDLKDMVLRCPVSTEASFNDDPLRIIRAFRFSVTKGFKLSVAMVGAVSDFNAELYDVVSIERTREELLKMFKYSTKETLQILYTMKLRNPSLYDKIMPEEMWLEPTLKSH